VAKTSHETYDNHGRERGKWLSLILQDTDDTRIIPLDIGWWERREEGFIHRKTFDPAADGYSNLVYLETEYNAKMTEYNAKIKKAEQEQKRKSAEYKRQLIAKYGAPNANKILERKVEIGWTMEMVRESLGLRLWGMNIQKSERQGIKIEVWTTTQHRSYTFTNGKLSGIDTY
jgi:hypothetical protein